MSAKEHQPSGLLRVITSILSAKVPQSLLAAPVADLLASFRFVLPLCTGANAVVDGPLLLFAFLLHSWVRLRPLLCNVLACVSTDVAQAKALSDEALLARYGPIKDDALRSQLRKANLTMYN
eukprot:1139043-Pelagomonas_calceolata.AAC.2